MYYILSCLRKSLCYFCYATLIVIIRINVVSISKTFKIAFVNPREKTHVRHNQLCYHKLQSYFQQFSETCLTLNWVCAYILALLGSGGCRRIQESSREYAERALRCLPCPAPRKRRAAAKRIQAGFPEVPSSLACWLCRRRPAILCTHTHRVRVLCSTHTAAPAESHSYQMHTGYKPQSVCVCVCVRGGGEPWGADHPWVCALPTPPAPPPTHTHTCMHARTHTPHPVSPQSSWKGDNALGTELWL